MSDHNYRLADLKMKRPDKVALALAVETLKERRDEARKAVNVSQYAVVSADGTVKAKMNDICHSALPDLIDPAYYDRRDDEEEDEAQVAPKNAKVPRYLVGWTNHHLKPEYHPRNNKPFEGKRLEACRAYYDWLRNRSHWSRFFAGPTDPDFLCDYGYVIDMSAPPAAVFFPCVAWRMPGEYVALVEQWYALCQCGVEPHLAFGMVQCLVGFHLKGKKAVIQTFCSKGHHLLSGASVETVARIALGIVHLPNKENRMPFNRAPTIYVNKAYQEYDRYGNGSSWILHPDLALNNDWFRLHTKRWKNWVGREESQTESRLKASVCRGPYSPVVMWLTERVYAIYRGWKLP